MKDEGTYLTKAQLKKKKIMEARRAEMIANGTIKAEDLDDDEDGNQRRVQLSRIKKKKTKSRLKMMKLNRRLRMLQRKIRLMRKQLRLLRRTVHHSKLIQERARYRKRRVKMRLMTGKQLTLMN